LNTNSRCGSLAGLVLPAPGIAVMEYKTTWQALSCYQPLLGGIRLVDLVASNWKEAGARRNPERG